MSVPERRIDIGNEAPIRKDGAYVLYWMIAARRTGWNFGLERAVEHAQALKRPLVVFEPLRIGYRWASVRHHLFVLEGMRANADACADAGVLYYPYVEPEDDADKGLLQAFARKACVVVTDEYPSFFLPRMVRSAAKRLHVRLEQIDSNGLLPLRATTKVFATAFSFRAWLQKNLEPYLTELPVPQPLSLLTKRRMPKLPAGLEQRWPRAGEALLNGEAKALAKLPIDQRVGPAAFRGGSVVARRDWLEPFLARKLARYREDRSHPDLEASSGLSPYLHFGHLSAHEVFAAVAKQEKWSPEHLSTKRGGAREGWWGMSAPAEAFLDQLVTWREIGFNLAHKRDDYDQYDSLPAWARRSLAKHEKDPRPKIYSTEELEAGRTGDPLWNAAQLQLVREGRLQNYMRMLWGKKVLEWSKTPREALELLVHLNNKYAVDGRDPNSYSGIFWVFGRYDRPWGPERPIYGHIRYMTSESTAKKLKVRQYVALHGPQNGLF